MGNSKGMTVEFGLPKKMILLMVILTIVLAEACSGVLL